MKTRLTQAALGVVIAVITLAGCATSERVAQLSQPVPTAAPSAPSAPPLKPWVTERTKFDADGSLYIVGFADENWPSPQSALHAAELEGRRQECLLVAEHARSRAGDLYGARVHPVLDDKKSTEGRSESLTLEERFLGNGLESVYRCNDAPRAIVKDWDYDSTGVAFGGRRGTYVLLSVPGREMAAFFRNTAYSMRARLDLLKTRREIAGETETNISDMIDRLEKSAAKWEAATGTAKAQ